MAGTNLLTQNLASGSPGYRLHCRSYTGPASYATGGFAADLATDMGIVGSIASTMIQSDAGYMGVYDSGNTTIKSYTSGGTETTATTDLSSVTFTVWAVEQL